MAYYIMQFEIVGFNQVIMFSSHKSFTCSENQSMHELECKEDFLWSLTDMQVTKHCYNIH